MRFARPIGALLALSFLACGGGGGQGSAPAQPDILDQLRAAPGISSVTEATSSIPQARFFTLSFTQPVDHRAIGGPVFQERLTLLYRSPTAPTTFVVTGYGINLGQGEAEATTLLQSNQIVLEHRYFAGSAPAGTLDWSKLDIYQMAADQHAVTQALRPILSGKWLGTGASKGGMTSIYHQRFFPQDVDATLAYVAPNSQGLADPRSIAFIDARAGGAYAPAIHAWQQAIFDHRAEVLPLFQAEAAQEGVTLDDLGADKALEFAVLEAPFTLWQYGDASVAAQVPPATATPAQLFAFLDLAYGGSAVDSWSDPTLAYFAPYYYQCGVQLGYPAVEDAELSGLNYRGQDLPQAYPPAGVTESSDAGAAMQDVQAWVSSSAQHIIFIYGENDPWSSEAFDLPAAAQARGNRLYIAPGGNHGSHLASLSDADRSEAYALLSTWLGASVHIGAAAHPLALPPQLRRSRLP